MRPSDAIRAASASHRGELAQLTRRAVILVVLALVVAIGIVAVVAVDARRVAGNAGEVRARETADEVARQLVAPISQRLLEDARARSAEVNRGKLRAANSRLAAADLPIVAEPPADADPEEVRFQALRAALLADLGQVDVVADGLRARFGDAGRFPPAFLQRVAPAPADEDVVVDVLPDVAPPTGGPTLVPLPAPPSSSSSSSSRAVPAPTGRVPAAPPATAPDPAPAPAPAPRRGLLEPCLLGSILC